MSDHGTTEVEPSPLAFLQQLQAESEKGFHAVLRAWVDDKSSVARALREYADRVTPPGSSAQPDEGES